MRSPLLFALSLLPAAFALSASNADSIAVQVLAARHVVPNPLRIAPRASVAASASASTSPSSSSALTDIIGLVTKGCNTTCNVFINELSGCAQGASQIAIASCACSSQVLGDIRTCAACISADSTTTNANAVSVVADYNSFVSLCIADGLATVTGTVAVGESTSSLSRTLIASTSSDSKSTSIPKTATYIATTQNSATASDVASLVAASGVRSNASATGNASGSAASAAVTKAAGAGRNGIVGGVVGVVLGAVGVWALVA